MAKKTSLAIVKTITRTRELMRKSQHMINLINKRDNFWDKITISWKKRDHLSYITVNVSIYQHHPYQFSKVQFPKLKTSKA